MTNEHFHKVVFIIFAFLSVTIISCNNNNAQRQFERDASGPAQNYTHTSSQGKVDGAKDPDDWRIGPMFQGYVELTNLPYPNPVATNNVINIQLTVTGLSSVYGLNIYYRDFNSQLKPIYRDPTSPLPTGIQPMIRINSSSLSPTGNPGDAKGLHRIFIYDNNDNLITYGDIMVQ